jgi:Fe-S oxidoreductase
MKSEFLYHYHRHHPPSRRERLLSQANRIAIQGSRFAPFSNWLLRSYLMRWMNEKWYGLDRRRRPPAFARKTFSQWWARHSRPSDGKASGSSQIALYVDTFTNHFEPRQAIAAVRIAESLGANVVVAPTVCCGRPLISKGFLEEASEQAAATVQALLPLAEQGIPIVFCEPSCFSAVRDDHPHLLRSELQAQARRVAESCFTFEQWSESYLAEREAEADSHFRRGPDRVLLHGHCHEKALIGMAPTERLLSRIPGCTVEVLDSGCCGMAGSFGYEREHYDISQAIGEQRLLPAVREQSGNTVVVAPGFSCRQQIQHFTGVKSLSPMELLASLVQGDQ